VYKIRVCLLLIFPVFLAACAFGYQAHGTLSDRPGVLRGKGYPGAIQGGGRFVLAESGSTFVCEGVANPPSGEVKASACGEGGGEGVLRCNDGRAISFQWRSITCRRFEGDGQDANGNLLRFRVDRMP
jgi:hypothetical protein